jgi:hypothetical protein
LFSAPLVNSADIQTPLLWKTTSRPLQKQCPFFGIFLKRYHCTFVGAGDITNVKATPLKRLCELKEEMDMKMVYFEIIQNDQRMAED